MAAAVKTIMQISSVCLKKKSNKNSFLQYLPLKFN